MKNIFVSAAIIFRENKVLITKRNGGEFHDLWEFPGGKIEPGETSAETVVREIKEELELVIEMVEPLITIEYQYPSFHLTMHTFWCKIVSGDLVLNDHSEYKWVTKKELPYINWVPADIEVVQAIIDSNTL